MNKIIISTIIGVLLAGTGIFLIFSNYDIPKRNIYIKEIPHTNDELCKGEYFVAPLEQEITYDNEIKKDEFVKYLREVLDKSVSGDNFDLVDYADYMKSKFIVLTIDIAPGGGASIVLIFKNRPDKVFYVWIYKYEDNSGYDLRGFTEYNLAKNEAPNIEKTQKLFINQLCDKDFGI